MDVLRRGDEYVAREAHVAQYCRDGHHLRAARERYLHVLGQRGGVGRYSYLHRVAYLGGNAQPHALHAAGFDAEARGGLFPYLFLERERVLRPRRRDGAEVAERAQHEHRRRRAARHRFREDDLLYAPVERARELRRTRGDFFVIPDGALEAHVAPRRFAYRHVRRRWRYRGADAHGLHREARFEQSGARDDGGRRMAERVERQRRRDLRAVVEEHVGVGRRGVRKRVDVGARGGEAGNPCERCFAYEQQKHC